MGGKDVVHIKQLQNSRLQSNEVQKLLKDLADKRFSENVNGSSSLNTLDLSGKTKVKRILKSAIPISNGSIICRTTWSYSAPQQLIIRMKGEKFIKIL